jgi:hypothetical protein
MVLRHGEIAQRQSHVRNVKKRTLSATTAGLAQIVGPLSLVYETFTAFSITMLTISQLAPMWNRLISNQSHYQVSPPSPIRCLGWSCQVEEPATRHPPTITSILMLRIATLLHFGMISEQVISQTIIDPMDCSRAQTYRILEHSTESKTLEYRLSSVLRASSRTNPAPSRVLRLNPRLMHKRNKFSCPG